jgi:very-short-patch-repair endonuclease
LYLCLLLLCTSLHNIRDGIRKNKEPDFVVCENGRWGILEVDGEPFHPPTRTTEDHKRDRDFLAHGIRVVQHYDANECYQQPDRVVANFLNLLRR